MGVVFFLSLPFMGVMLFPSFRLGNEPGEGVASLALLSLFFIRLLPPLFFSPFFVFSSFSSLSFLSLSLLSLSLHSVFLLCLLLPSPVPFFFGGTACTTCFQDVGDDVTDRNLIVIRL